MNESESKLIMTNKMYDILKRLVQVILPATSSAYFALAAIYDLPNPDKIVGTIAVVTTFLGVTLGISTAQYYKSDVPYDGNMVIRSNNVGNKMFSLELNSDPNDIEGKESISFKVHREPFEDFEDVDEG